jgi:hypothetical protein
VDPALPTAEGLPSVVGSPLRGPGSNPGNRRQMKTPRATSRRSNCLVAGEGFEVNAGLGPALPTAGGLPSVVGSPLTRPGFKSLPVVEK